MLTSHVLGGLILALISLAVVIAVALLIGYDSAAGPLRWLAALGLLLLLATALIWLSVVVGLSAKSVEVASNMPMILILLPFLGSGFVPVASMPTGLRWFAQHLVSGSRGAGIGHTLCGGSRKARGCRGALLDA